MDLMSDREFFRYLVSKIVQTTPGDESPEAYATNVLERAKLVFNKVKSIEQFLSTGEFK
jgi:hypothetical protein